MFSSRFFPFLAICCLCACHQKEDGPTTIGTPLTLTIPNSLPDMRIPEDNPLTVEGVALGRRLFYEPMLSGDNTMSCATCHQQESAFSDFRRFSRGIFGDFGDRNAPALFNLGWQRKFFWDGRATSLEDQALQPIQNPIEMHETLENAVAELIGHPEYPGLFKNAFGTGIVEAPLIAKALAQFERTMISANSRFDLWKQNQATLTPEEKRGMDLYNNPAKGDCAHCHVFGSTFSDFEFRNTGLDSIPTDKGLSVVTKLATDEGKFKTPSLRNVAYTAPYMHDGRFTTLEECVEHYNTGFKKTANLDPNMEHAPKGRLSSQDVSDLVAFLKMLSDPGYLANSAYKKPD